MPRLLTALVFLSLTVLTPTQGHAKKLGLDTTFGVGFQSLVGEGTYDAGIDGSVGFRAGVGYKIWPFLSLGVDLDYGLLDHDNRNLSVSTYHLLAVVKGHYDYQDIHFFLGLGFGYGGATIDGNGFEATYGSFTNSKVTVGGLYAIWKDLQIGGYMDVYLHFGGDLCEQSQGKAEDCTEQGDVYEFNHIIQFGVLTQYSF